MAQYSVYQVRFSLTNAAGKTTGGPYTTLVGVSGGTRGDQITHSLALTLASAISSNLQSILQAQGASGSSGAGGTVVVDSFNHAGSPDLWA